MKKLQVVEVGREFKTAFDKGRTLFIFARLDYADEKVSFSGRFDVADELILNALYSITRNATADSNGSYPVGGRPTFSSRRILQHFFGNVADYYRHNICKRHYLLPTLLTDQRTKEIVDNLIYSPGQFSQTDTTGYFHLFCLPYDYDDNAGEPEIFDTMLANILPFDNDMKEFNKNYDTSTIQRMIRCHFELEHQAIVKKHWSNSRSYSIEAVNLRN